MSSEALKHLLPLRKDETENILNKSIRNAFGSMPWRYPKE
jgi:hypothetical protein